MANIFENIGTFTLTRLRSTDASYLRGAVRPLGPTPIPTILATGPQVVGPGSILGVSTWWGLGIEVPAVPEVVWVVVGMDFSLKKAVGVGNLEIAYLMVFGDVADVDNVRGPIAGAATLSTIAPGATGTFVDLTAVKDPARPSQMWVPLDPADTSSGWHFGLAVLTSAAAGAGVGELSVDLSSVRLIGYPVNLWNTGAMWAGMAGRGS